MSNTKVKTGSYSFWADLERATKVEQEVVETLQGICGGSLLDVLHGEAKRGYDLRLTTLFGEVYVEVKADYSHARYGNVAVEYECRGKDSGINATTADYWIYRIFEKDGSSGLYLIRTEELKWMIHHEMHFRDVSGGDIGSGTHMYLFKGDVFKDECRLLATYPA